MNIFCRKYPKSNKTDALDDTNVFCVFVINTFKMQSAFTHFSLILVKL